ncbi:hypothetical protein ACIPSJ_15395 [Streptomyces sp. NPDC090088]|uniref:hypothetical protein n=1 Tax=Streptomyces sp. NPDC090088 TaxID=3365944 RepID=UPI0037F29702
MIKGFIEEVSTLPESIWDPMRPVVARHLGQQAAQSVLAPMIWAASVGEMIDTSRLSLMMGVSRQALAKRVAAGRLLGLPGRGTTHFPVWQFRPDWSVSPDATDIFKIFREALGHLDPYAVSAWINTASSELNGLTPGQWLARKPDSEPVLAVARRAAERLAS